jgi:hypothetical protein
MDDKNNPAPLTQSPDTEAQDNYGSSVATMDLFVSLFLILLCFFLVMDSISNQQLVKAHAAVKSVKTTFKDDLRKKPELMELVARGRLDAPSDQYFNQIHEMLAGMIDFPGQFPDREMNPIRVEVPPDVLFVHGKSRVRYDQARFFDDLATALKAAPPGEERSVEILIGSGPDLPGEAMTWRNLYVKRAANFAREMENRGVPNGLVSAGVLAADTDIVWLTFLTKRRGLDMSVGAVSLPGEGGPQ